MNKKLFFPVATLCFVVVFSIFCQKGYGQLHGTYTIDSSKISSSTNFNTFTNAVDSLTKNGVSGPVVFNIADGAYNESVKIRKIKGASLTNTITFKSALGDSNKVSLYFNGSSKRTLELDSVDYVTFKNMIILGSDSINIFIRGGKRDSFVNDILVQMSINYQGGNILINTSPDSGLVFLNNHIRGWGLVRESTGGGDPGKKGFGILVKNNTFDSAKIFLYQENNCRIIQNRINEPVYTGIYLYEVDSGAFVSKNRIYSIGGTGIDVGLLGRYGNNIISNNYVHVKDPKNTYSFNNDENQGIELGGTAGFYFNTVLITGDKADSFSRAIVVQNTGANLVIENNNFINYSSGYAMFVDTVTAIRVSDFNNYYTKSKKFILLSPDHSKSGKLNNLTLSGWQGASHQDGHSISVDPQIKDTTDSDIKSGSIWLVHKGSYINGISDDINGNLRPKLPTIGADELLPLKTCFAGTYTIDSSRAAGGTNFQTFTAAVDSITKYGVCGPVVFNVADGVYKERISIGAITGSSSTNTIIFQSASRDSTKVVVEDSLISAYYHTTSILVSVANPYTTFRGMTFRCLTKIFSNVADLFDIDATHISILNSVLVFDSINNFFLGSGIVVGDSFATIKNNIIRKAYFGVRLWDVSNVDISNNLIDSCKEDGIYSIVVNRLKIDHNIINNSVEIWGDDAVHNTFDSTTFWFTNNRMYSFNRDWRLYCYEIKSPSLSPSLVTNNFMSATYDGTNKAAIYAGVECSSCKNINWYFNSILISGTKFISSSGSFWGSSDTGVNILNNSFVCQSNYPYALYDGYIVHSDYNNIYSGDSFIGQYNYTYSKTISDWQTASGQDAHSVSINPQFLSSTDLRATNDSLSGKGIAISGITNDIDGTTRPNPPTIGANEIAAPPFKKHITPRFSSRDTSCTYTSMTFSDSSRSDSCGTINSWLWSFGDGDTSSAQDPTHSYYTAGLYTIKLIVSSSGGCADSFTKNIFIDSTCVWPGDANDNKLVEITDVLNIGIAFNDSGPSRGVPNNMWYGQRSRNWGKKFTTGTDYKHADCNGDGVIDSFDVMAININWGGRHYKTGQPLGNPNNPPFYLSFAKTSYAAGDTVTADLILGETGKTLSNAYGFAFAYNYDPAYVKSGTLNVNFTNSWFGTPGKDILPFVKNDGVNGLLATAVTRTDHKNVSGMGKIGTLSFVTENASVGTPVVFNPMQAKLISFSETSIPIYLGLDSFIAGTKTGIATTNNDIKGISIYPNPVNSILTIDAGTNLVQSIAIFDEVGREVYSQQNLKMINQSIYVGNLSTGIYVIKLGLENGEFVGRFVKE